MDEKKNQTETFTIRVHLRDIEQPFALRVQRNTGDEKLLRDAAEKINAYYDEYRDRIKGLDSTSYYAMVALLMARMYMESNNREKNLAQKLDELESDLLAMLNEETAVQ